jgi:type II secretory ATPase GspE/PulE/Tfp pilus assembly ATPase PilB-like protein
VEALREELARESGVVLPDVLYRGKGCRQCQGTGFRGRSGVFELMPITEELRALVMERAPTQKMRAVAIQQGMNSLRADGWRLVREGRTTVEEVMRVTKEEHGGAEPVPAWESGAAEGASAAAAQPG